MRVLGYSQRRLFAGLFATALLIGISLGAAWACRCAQESLTAYFDRADVVFLGKVMEVSDPSNPERPERVIRFEVQGHAFKGNPSSEDRYSTASNTAGCGIEASTGGLYLVFGERDPKETRIVYVHTCNGTRPFDPTVPDAVAGFSDMPPNQVLRALFNLSRAEETRRLPIGGVPKKQSIIGLVELPGSVTNVAAGVSAVTVPSVDPLVLREQPDQASAPVGRIQVPTDVETRESSYETVAAVVYEEHDGWLRLKTNQGLFAWLAPTPGATYHPLSTLLIRRLSYLTPAWDGRLWPDPGAGYPMRPKISPELRGETPIEVIETQNVADSIWLRVQLFSSDPCSGSEPMKADAGWIPAWNADGELTSWYWSRGC